MFKSASGALGKALVQKECNLHFAELAKRAQLAKREARMQFSFPSVPGVHHDFRVIVMYFGEFSHPCF